MTRSSKQEGAKRTAVRRFRIEFKHFLVPGHAFRYPLNVWATIQNRKITKAWGDQILSTLWILVQMRYQILLLTNKIRSGYFSNLATGSYFNLKFSLKTVYMFFYERKEKKRVIFMQILPIDMRSDMQSTTYLFSNVTELSLTLSKKGGQTEIRRLHLLLFYDW